jgi:cysteine desulfurase
MIYLDHAAMTPPEDIALLAIGEALRSGAGNPDSVHSAGREARHLFERGRMQIGEYLGCAPSELRVTPSGGIALRAALEWVLARTSGKIVASPLEHPRVLDVLKSAESAGREVRWLKQPGGELGPDVGEDTAGAEVVVCSPLNHELGTQVKVQELFHLAKDAFWVLDAVQAAAWLDLGPLLRERAFIVASSAKLGGLPGVGLLRVPPELGFGAAFESELLPSPGALCWPAVAGLGAACGQRKPARDEARDRVCALARVLLTGMRDAAPDLAHNAGQTWMGPILSVSLPDVDGRALEAALDLRGVCVSRTSACQQRSTTGSPVVRSAFSDEPWRSCNATRWSLGWSTTPEDVDAAVAAFADAIRGLRRI